MALRKTFLGAVSQRLGLYAALLALLGCRALSVVGASEDRTLQRIETYVETKEKRFDSLYIRVRRETTVSVGAKVLRAWTRQMALPEYSGWDEVLFAFKGEKRYSRVLGLEYRTTLPSESASDQRDQAELRLDEAKTWNMRTLFQRIKDFRSGDYFYQERSVNEARDALSPPEYLMNIGWAVPDPTGKDEAKRNRQQMCLLPELLTRWPYVVVGTAERMDGTPCALLEGKITSLLLPSFEGSHSKRIFDRLWLDAEHGFAIRKRETLVDGQLYRVLNWDFVEVMPGFWLPRRSKTETYAPADAGMQFLGRPVITSDMRLCLWIVNQLSDEMFDVVLTKSGR